MIVLICGGRDYEDGERVFQELARVHYLRPVTHVVEGGARGADHWGREAARRLGIPVTTISADWHTHGRKAGPLRNERMLMEVVLPYEGDKLCLAFPTLQSIGTWDMVRRCKKAGVERIII